jgi:hypothetical protein
MLLPIPDPPQVKRRKVRGVRNALCAVDLGITIWIVEKCMEHTPGAEKNVLGKLRISAFYEFFPIFSHRHHQGDFVLNYS